MEKRQLRIALAGNPNSGKTTIFNNLTGTRQKVGNWPGVTVEKKEGDIHQFGYDMKIIDLPGTYSLTPFSIEEIVARDFILDENPDVVIDIIDASNLERNLYLANQLRELDCKVIFALNMADVAKSRGFRIDAAKLSELLGVPVVFTVGNKNEGLDDLLKAAIALAESPLEIPEERKVRYSNDIESAILELRNFIKPRVDLSFPYNLRWTAVKLLEDDKIIKDRIREKIGAESRNILIKAEELRGKLSGRFDDDPEIVMTDERYGFIAGIIKEVLSISTRQRVDISRNIDLVLTNRFLGFPIFIFFIWAMFQVTFSLGAYPMEWIDAGVGYASVFFEYVLPDSLLKDLIVDGIIAGVGSIIIFLPNILLLFFCIALFEDTGYMARAAFLMDRIMHLIGLHGKSFIPMLMGFGCNVPAIIATRSLESRKDRILTILITPFMSCSAKLPVYIALAGTFFAAHAGTVIFIIYLFGILVAIITGRLFRTALLRGEDAPFVMELPPYRVPMMKNLLIHMWDRSKMFLKKMGGIILAGSIVIWVLSSFPQNIQYSKDYDAQIAQVNQAYEKKISSGESIDEAWRRLKKEALIKEIASAKEAERAEKSYIGRIGKVIEPFFQPIGIDWRGSVALLTGFVAKEIVISTMGVLYAAEGDSEGDSESDALRNALLKSGMTPLSALSMMIFVLLYVPCLATIGAITRETGSMKWTLFHIAFTTGVAWGMSFIVFQGGRLLGF
ncbi:MAG: ferrous iron transport protein B [Desulfobacteraceae bacterium]|nr:ferrous iron transport protein B [Desulfobacteraceae bacterium]MBC2757810.1 ferrous iron transport protein B [Desulfobacteraceae bacterium]